VNNMYSVCCDIVSCLKL